MSFAARSNRSVAASGGPVNGTASIAGDQYGSGISGTYTAVTNGTQTATSSSFAFDYSSCDPNWYSPTTAAIGNSYWVKVTLNSGSAWDSGLVNNTVYALTSNRALTWTVSTLNTSKSANVSVRFYSDAGGTTLVATHTLTVAINAFSI
jgi:hypothetical protein